MGKRMRLPDTPHEERDVRVFKEPRAGQRRKCLMCDVPEFPELAGPATVLALKCNVIKVFAGCKNCDLLVLVLQCAASALMEPAMLKEAKVFRQCVVTIAPRPKVTIDIFWAPPSAYVPRNPGNAVVSVGRRAGERIALPNELREAVFNPPLRVHAKWPVRRPQSRQAVAASSIVSVPSAGRSSTTSRRKASQRGLLSPVNRRSANAIPTSPRARSRVYSGNARTRLIDDRAEAKISSRRTISAASPTIGSVEAHS